MILNTRIWKETVNAAKAAAATSPAWLRAIERARIEIEKASYWSFDGSTLAIISTTSKKLYRLDDNHACEAKGRICKHRASRRLMQRYSERLAAAPVRPEDERAELIADIEATWKAKHPGQHMADALMSRFRCNKLEMLKVDFLRRIQATLAQ